MTAYVQFTPSPLGNFQFAPVLDGATYNAIITWNYAGQRYYVNLYNGSGNLIFCLPLIASPDDYNISLTAGYFTTTLVFRDSDQTFEVG